MEKGQGKCEGEGVGLKERNNCQEKWRWMFLGCLEGNREEKKEWKYELIPFEDPGKR